MRRLALILAALLASSPAGAADAWHGGTLSGSGRTETLAYPATCDSDTALVINRRGTSLTNALTKLEVSASAITATTHTPASPTLMEKILGVGCNSTTALVSGSGTWIQSAALSNLASWTLESNASASGQGNGGTITPTSPDKVWQVTNICPGCSTTRLFNFSIGSFSLGNIAGSSPVAGDVEAVGTSINSNFYCSLAGEYSSGTPTMRGYSSGTSFAFTTTAGAIMNTGTYFYPPFGLSATACISTHKKANNSHTYIMSAPIGGTITTIDAGVIDLIPLGDWDPTGSLRRAWWVSKADGTVRVSNSASAPTSISTNATYDIGSTPLGGSTPLFAITGLDLDGDGTTTDNPLVLMADGSHYAAWGSCADTDDDGYGSVDSIFCASHGVDCDDGSSGVNPGATEVANDGIDQDCSGGDLVQTLSRPRPASAGAQALQVLRRLFP